MSVQQLYQLSYQANWRLVVMWGDDKSVDDGYRSILCMILIHVFEQIIDYKANCVN